ncbi:hypothetical protein FRC10_001859 [Ceratobasidium sp. 414]|nr:hypothetical protein FRC10_001859 [Ceratobasidium sp. 414]
MSSSLPLSLSPHVVVLASTDLVSLLQDNKLPPLHDLLRSFTPLESISARTTALASVTHDRYFIRFSNLQDVEAASKEDEEVRAGRTFDWMGARISRRAAAWVAEVEEKPLNLGKEMKWWQDLRLCAEGDIAPTRTEGWNYPVALILATSTMASNPLQSITALHSRALEFPPWVDSTLLKFTLIIHPMATSPLNMDESQALLNAARKQYGVHAHLVPWSLSAPSITQPFIPALPSLPPSPNALLDTPSRQQLDDLTEVAGHDAVPMSEEDRQSTNRFVREFVTQSLIPWMERNVVEWNEAYVAARRLPSRLFSTTRRFFGTSGSSTPVPSSPSSPAPSTAIQQRRLAEFATFLGDLKLATSVFDTLRKDTSNTSASDILPLLLAPSKSIGSHAVNALLGARFVGKEPSPSSQLRALKYAVRWERGIGDLNAIGGDNWLVWAAGSDLLTRHYQSEEAPAALLLAQAAQMCARKGSLRRATLCYVAAANRLDKCGIKPLTMHFLRLARDLCNAPVRKMLSPAFFESEDNPKCGFEGIAPGIEHALGRLKYTTGDTEGAVGIFLALLQSADVREATKGDDEIYVEDFKLALEHLVSTSGQEAASKLKLPIRFCQPQKTQIRVGTLDADDGTEIWEDLEERWKSFWKPNGPCTLRSSGRAQAEEMFWVELSIHNPLDAEVTLSDLTLVVDAQGVNVTIESLSEVMLRPKETRLLHMGLTAQSPGTLAVTHITYTFLSLLPATEPLAWRGTRLHATPQQRQGKIYAPDRAVRIEVLPRGARLEVELAEADSRVMCLGEMRNAVVRVENPLVGGGAGVVRDVWIVMDHQGDIGSSTNVLSTRNTLDAPEPMSLPLDRLTGSTLLAPGRHLDLQLAYCGHEPGLHDISALLVFRKEEDATFYTARMRIPFHVEPRIQVTACVQPSAATSTCAYSLVVETENAGTSQVQISQLSTAGIAWGMQRNVPVDDGIPIAGILVSSPLLSISPTQLGRTFATLESRSPDSVAQAIETRAFATRQLRSALEVRHFLLASRRAHVLRQLKIQFPLIPTARAVTLVPLFGANDLDVILEYTSSDARGFLFAHGLQVGGVHGELSGEEDEDIEWDPNPSGAKKKKRGRTMYAETEREREMLAAQIRASAWNASGPCVSVDVGPVGADAAVQTGKNSIIPVTFALRNFSLSRTVKCVLDLKLRPDAALSSKTLRPLETCQIQARMLVSQPGVYGLGGWVVRCEVAASNKGEWKVGQVYEILAPEMEEDVIVVHRVPT